MAFDTHKKEMWGVNIQLDQETDDIKAKIMCFQIPRKFKL